jgi:hypothetical protein
VKPTRDLDDLFKRMAYRKRHTQYWEMRLRGLTLPKLRREAEVIIEEQPDWREETIIKPVIKIKKVKKTRVVKKSAPANKLKQTFTERQMQIALAALERKNNG